MWPYIDQSSPIVLSVEVEIPITNERLDTNLFNALFSVADLRLSQRADRLARQTPICIPTTLTRGTAKTARAM